ncbi:DUF6907 domain-containing protein [Streptomyces sp. NBC_01264]|uniref:DUF6907 domain-containing protein n=1 Tax=Streptomyces sp. NBC_01264 TaxID=2903804 RepID=UPI0022550BB2|nr:hypothetical protein [Streptomyces sp. NBC_01264]MCX4780123.1 hypothetical protein [Streptomyces sp. NBC_01264]
MSTQLLAGSLDTDRTVRVGPRRYQGPGAVPGLVLQVECPDWCAEDHTADWANGTHRRLSDDFHESAPICVVPMRAPSGDFPDVQALLTARLMVHTTEGGLAPDAAVIFVSLDGWDNTVDMGVEETDDLIAQLTDYTARLRLMRDQLAAIIGAN